MPELPEINRYSTNINNWCNGKVFARIETFGGKSAPDVSCSNVAIKSTARGKELVLQLTIAGVPVDTIRFNHGLVGGWQFSANISSDLPPNTRLAFVTTSGEALCYVDAMNMGSWTVGSWGGDRGPCPLTEHSAFCRKVQTAVGSAAFNKPLAEVLLDQEYFNGIGNYLRAEICHRARIHPFSIANAVFADQDALARVCDLAKSIPEEVLKRNLNKYGTPAEKESFKAWLQCYEKTPFENDKKKRKMYFDPVVCGPLLTTPAKTEAKAGVAVSRPASGATAAASGRVVLPALTGGWAARLSGEMEKPYFAQLLKFLDGEFASGQQVFPPLEDVFNAFTLTPLETVKVVIVGQDPYHDNGQAHGLCFSVCNEGIAVPPSLKNIYKELSSDTGFQAPGHGNLTEWAQRGVLLLNTVLTVRAHMANSHAKRGWEEFTTAALRAVSDGAAGKVVFLAWGAPAQALCAKNVDRTKHAVLETVHPSPLSASRGFFDCRHFSKANEILVAAGRGAVEWQLSAHAPPRRSAVPAAVAPKAAAGGAAVKAASVAAPRAGTTTPPVSAPAAARIAELSMELLSLFPDDANYTPHYTFNANDARAAAVAGPGAAAKPALSVVIPQQSGAPASTTPLAFGIPAVSAASKIAHKLAEMKAEMKAKYTRGAPTSGATTTSVSAPSSASTTPVAATTPASSGSLRSVTPPPTTATLPTPTGAAAAAAAAMPPPPSSMLPPTGRRSLTPPPAGVAARASASTTMPPPAPGSWRSVTPPPSRTGGATSAADGVSATTPSSTTSASSAGPLFGAMPRSSSMSNVAASTTTFGARTTPTAAPAAPPSAPSSTTAARPGLTAFATSFVSSAAARAGVTTTAASLKDDYLKKYGMKK